ncbi:MAG: hypothetical protein K6E36_06535 [Oscillospiraceae bacterium]|nr:hypothetical protein [Oscillospiraceae bacterium]
MNDTFIIADSAEIVTRKIVRKANTVRFVKKSKDFPLFFALHHVSENFFCENAKKGLHFFVKYAKIGVVSFEDFKTAVFRFHALFSLFRTDCANFGGHSGIMHKWQNDQFVKMPRCSAGRAKASKGASHPWQD